MTDDVRILLVDDEPLVLRSLEKTLLRAGFDVKTAGDMSSALSLFKETVEGGASFDLAILDLHMPNLQGRDDPNAGLDLLSQLLAQAPGLPVVVLTAFDEVARAKEAVPRGARAYFVKGRETALVDVVNEIVNS